MSFLGRHPADEDRDTADASARGTAGELVLSFCGRIPLDSLQLDGEPHQFELVRAWEPED
ncbi:hypothetical protein [Streptomyces adustus]